MDTKTNLNRHKGLLIVEFNWFLIEFLTKYCMATGNSWDYFLHKLKLVRICCITTPRVFYRAGPCAGPCAGPGDNIGTNQ